MGTPRIRRATEEDSGALAALVPGLVPSSTDEYHAIFVVDGADGPLAVLDLAQGKRHLDLLHLSAPDGVVARTLHDFAEAAAQALKAREIRLAPGAMTPEQAQSLGYTGGVKRVRPRGVPLWRDGTGGFIHSLYFRGVWASVALVAGLSSVALAVFGGREFTLGQMLMAAAGVLFAIWQLLLIMQAARRSSILVLALSVLAALWAAGSLSGVLNDHALPTLRELGAIRADNTPLASLDIDVSPDRRTLYVSGAYGPQSEDAVRQALEQNTEIAKVVIAGPGGSGVVGLALFRMFRERKLATHVERSCASACAIAFLGGVERTVSPSGRLGFHRADFTGMGDDDMHDANRGSRTFMLDNAGLTPEFVQRVTDTSPELTWVPNREELLAGKVTTR